MPCGTFHGGETNNSSVVANCGTKKTHKGWLLKMTTFLHFLKEHTTINLFYFTNNG
jgi:hypothetical protein